MKKTWYLLSYDICNEKRLKKFHYHLSKQALALQKSLFLLEANTQKLNNIIKLVEQYTHTLEDDVRLYPITHPNALWGAGIQRQSFQGISVQPQPSNLPRFSFTQTIEKIWNGRCY